MITCSINQPYFFPYFGYFCLLAKSDIFISLDNVSMIKKGYIHRNSILLNGKEYKFTIPLKKISQNRQICETYTTNYMEFYSKFAAIVELAYSKSPYYEQVLQLVEGIKFSDDVKISDLAEQSIQSVTSMLELPVKKLRSSDTLQNGGPGQDRIISLCKSVGANQYLNLTSGRNLYNESEFDRHGLRLKFLDLNFKKYDRFISTNGSYASILDTLARFSKDDVREIITS